LAIALLGAAAPPSSTKKSTPGKAPGPASDGSATATPANKEKLAPKAAEREPEAKPIPKVDPKIFDEALQDYFDGNQRKAAGKLFAYVEATAQTEENYAWAQYFLAKSLIELGLRHAGGVYLAKIARERSNPAVLPRALEDLRFLTEVPHDETMIDEQVFGALDLGFLPDETAAFAHYHQGLWDLRVGSERWALIHFAKLREGSTEASRAKFVVLVTRLKDHKGVSKEMVDDFLELAKDQKLSQETRNESMLAVARLRYEAKDYQGALDAYEKVQLPALHPGRATLYLEEAWARYQLGQIHAAMGLLTTLDAPVFRDEFLPDKYLLRALIYKDLCHYLPAKRAAKELTRRFAESLEMIRDREDLTKDVRLKRAASAQGATQRAAKFLQSLTLEGERVGRYAGSFGERLYAHLTKLYDLAHAEAQRQYELRLNESVRAEADKLLRAAEQVRLMEYEVGLKLYERVKKGAKLVLPEEDPELTSAQVAYRFDGEYWNDELRDYRVSLKSRCIEEASR
jgi:hypothetical protein